MDAESISIEIASTDLIIFWNAAKNIQTLPLCRGNHKSFLRTIIQVADPRDVEMASYIHADVVQWKRLLAGLSTC